jgi:cytochrome c oxidase subunit II
MNPATIPGRLDFGLAPASDNAAEVDWLFLALLVITLAVLALVFGLMLLYMVRYRAGSPVERGKVAHKTFRFEISWTVATLVVFFGLFVWGADLYTRLFEPPSDAMKIYVVGKQWMWKVEYPGGQREIDSLHVPVGRPVELLMTSEDVIHDFDLPDFRLKHDVLPGRYEAIWFRANRAGTYHLFCSRFCGTDHSHMRGEMVVMDGPDYQKWLEQNGTAGGMAAQGSALFNRFGCGGCHYVGPGTGGGTVRAPSLVGLYGSPVPLSDKSVVIADDRYVRDSILEPSAQVVASYEDKMPNFSAQLSEEDVLKLIAYIKSLGSGS